MRDKIKTLLVDTPQGESGKLLRESQYVFNYTTAERDCELALGMPLRAASYTGNQLPPVFTMNIPEGALRAAIKARYEKQFAKLDDMALLAIVGHDQIGRLTLREPEVAPWAPGAQVGLREVLSATANDKLFEHLMDTYLAGGVSGVQPKVLMPDADLIPDSEKTTVMVSDLIVKASGLAYPNLTANEFLCMDAARRASLDVPEFHLSDDGSLFVVRRFDRTEDGTRLGFEDMAVAAGRPYDEYGNYKYRGSYEDIATLIEVYCGANAAESKQRLFEYVALSCMVRNGDAHAKNFGLLYDSPADPQSVRLAPLFDVVTTSVYERESHMGQVTTDRTLALKLNKSDQYPDRKSLVAFGQQRCNVLKPEAVLDRLAEAMSASLTANRDRVPPDLLAKMRHEWDMGRLSLERSHSRLAGLSGKRPQVPTGRSEPAWSAEQAERATALPSIQKAAVGALLAFCEHADTAIKAAGDARRVDWRAVEDAAMRQSIASDHQEPEAVFKAISDASPGCTLEVRRVALRGRVNAVAAQAQRDATTRPDTHTPEL